MDKRLYPVSESFFKTEIKPLIEKCYSAAGCPQKVRDYQVFNAILYVLRTGIPWRDLPKCYGYWHTVYPRIKPRGSRRGAFTFSKILISKEIYCCVQRHELDQWVR